jgi:hypothetical protein
MPGSPSPLRAKTGRAAARGTSVERLRWLPESEVTAVTAAFSALRACGHTTPPGYHVTLNPLPLETVHQTNGDVRLHGACPSMWSSTYQTRLACLIQRSSGMAHLAHARAHSHAHKRRTSHCECNDPVVYPAPPCALTSGTSLKTSVRTPPAAHTPRSSTR